jgi:hypothetical protein
MVYNSEEQGGGAHRTERESPAGMVKEPMTRLPLAPKSSPGLTARLRASPLPPLGGIWSRKKREGQNTKKEYK